MPNHVPLTALNRLRFPECPRPMTTLRYQARNKLLPGAFLLGGAWMVDLDVFDATIREQTDPAAPAPSSTPEALTLAAQDIINRLTLKKAS